MNDVQLGFLAVEKRDYQEAINIFRRALDHKQESKAFLGLGIAHYHLGDFPTARWALSKVLELDHANVTAKKYIEMISGTRETKSVARRASLFRAGKGCLERHDGTWRKCFIKGINMGLGLPGYFPGEYPVKRGTYLAWFGQIADLGVNAVRIYTVHPPAFYEALGIFNASGKRLYLFQGVWTELPPKNDFSDPRFTADLQKNIRDAVDAVCGNAVLPEKPGYASGTYEHDVSSLLAGFILGREWESCAVREFNTMQRRTPRDYRGAFLSIRGGTPFEVWTTEVCDFLQNCEYEKYRLSHPVSVVSWPTLDPLVHPSESTYEEEAKLQGLALQKDKCIDEDIEVLDVAKITVAQGNGFFAVYHAYPYYPDFMNHEYQKEHNTYRAYLNALKSHYRDLPVLIGEFGVPSSRESAHWHKDGWHHGGHTEARQGEINGALMKTIHETGMAGGILFSWFDEWFKRNWVFSPYELPAERKPLWYNLQDPEQNYGLLAAYPGYPGKKATLTGNAQDWKDSRVLSEKSGDAMVFRFGDGFDKARTLLRLSAQHDEGFLYLKIDTGGTIDFSRANFLIGLDTGHPETGERLLPAGTNLMAPIGLKFVFHLAGKKKSRVLACSSYDKNLNWKTGKIRPTVSDQGAWVVMQNQTNVRRISKDGKRFYPPHTFTMSALRHGSLERGHAEYDTLADFFSSGNTIELRIPWGLIQVADPSSKAIVWLDKKNQTRTTEGIRVLAVSYKPEAGALRARKTGMASNITDCLPERVESTIPATYTWDGWNIPVYHTYVKESYYRFQQALADIPEEA